jgi:hypothetical protein
MEKGAVKIAYWLMANAYWGYWRRGAGRTGGVEAVSRIDAKTKKGKPKPPPSRPGEPAGPKHRPPTQDCDSTNSEIRHLTTDI